MRRRLVAFAIASFAVGAGCHHRGAGPAAIEWTSDHEFHVVGAPEQRGDVSIFEGNYQVTLFKFPAGARWDAGGRTGHLESDIYSIIKVAPVEEKMGAAATARIEDAKIDPQTRLRVTVPGGDMVTVELPALGFRYSLASYLERIENGPVLFGDEPPKKITAPESIFALDGGASMKLFGRAFLVRDVDALSRTRTLPDVKGTRVCGGYTSKGKALPDIKLRFKETEVTVYDRRGGQVIARKVFAPDTSCPMIAFRGFGSDDGQDSYAPTEEIHAWLRSLVNR